MQWNSYFLAWYIKGQICMQSIGKFIITLQWECFAWWRQSRGPNIHGYIILQQYYNILQEVVIGPIFRSISMRTSYGKVLIQLWGECPNCSVARDIHTIYGRDQVDKLLHLIARLPLQQGVRPATLSTHRDHILIYSTTTWYVRYQPWVE